VTDKKNRRPILNEPPVLEMKALEETCQEVSLRIVRSTPSGQWSTIAPQTLKPLLDLKSGELEKWLADYAGGGSFVIEARDPSTMETVLPRWRIVLPGAPKDPKRNLPQPGVMGGSIPGMVPGVGGIPVPPAALAAGLPAPRMAGPGQVTLPPQDQLPRWASSYSAGDQWSVFYDQALRGGQLPQGASMHSDALAYTQAQTWQTQHSQERAENAKIRTELEQARKEMRDLIDKKDEEIRRVERARAEEKAEGQMLALRAEINAMRDNRGMDWAPIAAAIAPIAAAWIATGKDREKIEADRTLKTMELSASQNATMIQTLVKGKDGNLDWVKLLPALAPLIIEFMKNTGPAAAAEAQATADETKMMQFKMISDLIMAQAQQGGDAPWWLPMVQSIMEGLGDMAQTVGRTAPTRQLPAGAPQAQLAQQDPATVATGDDAEVWRQLETLDPDAAQLTQVVWKNVPVEAGFHTHEWRLLIFNIHSQVLPQKLAPKIVDHLEHLHDFEMLPNVLRDVFEHPQKIAEVIMALPIGQRSPDYAQLLIQTVVGELQSRAEAYEGQSEEAPTYEPPGSIVTPPPDPEEALEKALEVVSDEPQPPQSDASEDGNGEQVVGPTDEPVTPFTSVEIETQPQGDQR
jgi:hypothetical protein